MASSSNMASNAPIIPPPPVLSIFLRLRFRPQLMEWTFYRETMVQYQLDNALLNYTASSARPFHDAVGIVVNGKLYVDDEPFWRNLLVHGATYNVAYLRRPFWETPWTRVRDAVAKTPLLSPKHGLPGRSDLFVSRNAYAVLLAAGAVTGTERISVHGRMFARLCNTRSPAEMERALADGRWVDLERMVLVQMYGLVVDGNRA